MGSNTQKVYVYDEEVTIRRRKIAMEMDKDFVQMYKNLPIFFLRLRSPWSPKFITWLISRMAADNIVDISSRAIREFQAWVREMGGGMESPAERTIRDVIAELVEQNLLLHLNRGTYKVNPALFWQKSISERADQVRLLLEGGHKLEPNIVVIEESEEEIRKLNGKEKDDSKESSSSVEESTTGASGS